MGPLSILLKNAFVAFLNRGRCAEPGSAPVRKITTWVAILSSHPWNDAVCRIQSTDCSSENNFHPPRRATHDKQHDEIVP